METQSPASYHFRVDFDDSSFQNDNNFMSVSGLDARLVYENEFTDKPAGAIFGNIVLRRPFRFESKLTISVLNIINTQRKQFLDLKIILLNAKHEPVVTWFITRAQPVRYALDEFNATTSAVATETFELRCGSIDLSKPKRTIKNLKN